LQAVLLTNGYRVVMTRTSQTSVALSNTDRANICNAQTAAGAPDTVLSIHLNASTNSSIDYFKAFFGKQIKDAAFTLLKVKHFCRQRPTGCATSLLSQ
jgi:N-acetylmuramoyl-L-alanine amidase